MASKKKKKAEVVVGPEWVRAVCLALPGTTEDLKWGNDVCFSVGGKMYCAMGLTGEGFGFKCVPPVQAALIERPDIVYAKYVGKHGWVSVERWSALPAGEAVALLATSHRLVFAKLPKRTQAHVDPELAAAVAAEARAAKGR